MKRFDQPKSTRLLIVGQTPPPYVGQMLSIESLVRAEIPDIETHHVRMNYSRTIDEIGTVRIGKLFHLLRVMIESAYRICRHRIDVIYYPPGAATVPILRDIVTLLWLRLFRRKLILVFHASGLSETAASWKGPLRWVFEKAFFYPEAAVQKSRLNPPDAAFVKARSIYYLPNGVKDQFERLRDPRPLNFVPIILFVGLVRADKGVDVLLEAARLLKQQGAQFLIRIVGEFASEEYRQQLVGQIEASGLEQQVQLCGPKVGDEKWELFDSADIFCFPSYYPAESFGNVLLEAMMFRLPVVSTRWRGIPDIVVDGETGFLVAIKDAEATAAKLAVLLSDKTLRDRLGENGRRRYLEKFTVSEYLQKHREVVLEVAARSRVRDRPHQEQAFTQRDVLSARHSESRQAAPSLPVLGVNVSRVDYDRAVEAIIGAAKRKESFGVAAVAVHGVMEAHHDRTFAELLNRLHLVTPDGQPVRWALNLLGARELTDRVYGPTLTLKLCERAAAERLPVFLYGSTPEVSARLSANLKAKFPDLIIAGTLAPPFGQRSPEEDEEDIRTINASGARIVFVGLGCPRQEKWVALHLDRIQAAMIGVGAAFDFHAGTVPQAPKALQDYGLEWLFRLLVEPKRLWRRYLILNPLFVLGFSRQLLRTKFEW